MALNANNIPAALFLIDNAPIDINSKDKNGNTLLHLICAQKETSGVLEYLLNRKDIDVNALNNNGETPLIAALNARNVRTAGMLIDEPRVKINVQDRDGMTPLHVACIQEGETDILKRLLDRVDIDVNISNNKGNTPLNLAVSIAPSHVSLLLMQDARVNVNVQNTITGITPLHRACENGDSEIIHALLAKDQLKPNIQDRLGQTALIYGYIINSGKTDSSLSTGIVKTLIQDNRIDLNIPDNAGNTLLHYACDRGDSVTTQTILTSGSASINFLNSKGHTALHYACGKGYLRIVTLLLEYGANPLTKGDRSNSALAIALANGHGKCVKELIKYGACNEWQEQEIFHQEEMRTSFTAESVCELLEDFEEIIQLIKEKDLPILSLIIELLKERAQDIVVISRSLNRSPFEIAFFLQSKELVEALQNTLEKSNVYEEIAVLQLAYPKACDNILNLFFEVHQSHYLLVNSQYSKLLPPPQGIRLEDFQKIVDTLNFTEHEQPNYINPNKIIIFNEQVEVSDFIEQVSKYFTNVLERKVLTMPESNPTASIYYHRLETALKHIIAKLAGENPETKFSALLELAAASGYCAAPYQQVALSLYQKLCLGILPKQDFEEEIYEILRQQREMALEFMCFEPYVNQKQSVHALNYFKSTLGPVLGLLQDDYDDVALTSGFINFELPSETQLWDSFNKFYNPSAVYANILESLTSPELKSKYLAWTEKKFKYLLQSDDSTKEIVHLKREVRALQDKYVYIDLQLIDTPEKNVKRREELTVKKQSLLQEIKEKKATLEEKGVSVLLGMSGLSEASKEELTERLRSKILSPIDGTPISMLLIQALEKLHVLKQLG